MNFDCFRAYDIRGVYPTDLDEEQVRLLASIAERRGEEVGRKGVFDKIKEAFR